jgi:hypothetical protein
MIIFMLSLGILSVALVSRCVQETVRTAYHTLTSSVPAQARVAKFWVIGAIILMFAVLATVVSVLRAMDASFAQGAESRSCGWRASAWA